MVSVAEEIGKIQTYQFKHLMKDKLILRLHSFLEYWGKKLSTIFFSRKYNFTFEIHINKLLYILEL